MTIRVDKNSVKVQATKDPNIKLVTASVTEEPDTIKDVTLHTFTVKWNTNTGYAGLRALFQAKIDADSEDRSIETAIKNAVGEVLSSTTEETSATINKV